MLKYEKGKIVTGQVTGIEKYGIFVSLDEFYSGLIHISEISDGYVKSISDYVNIGETIKARVVEVDDDNYHVKLSIKNFKYKIKKRARIPLKETKEGFTPLGKMLPIWVENRMQEIKNKKK